MATTTRTHEKRSDKVKIMQPIPQQSSPETATALEDPPETADASDAEESPDIEAVLGNTTVVETANQEEIEKRKKRAGRPGAGFFPKLSAYPQHEWERMKIYIYRLAPITDRTAGGQPLKFLTIYQEAIDEYTVLRDHGSGKYRLILITTTKRTPAPQWGK
jgi:hypothetical protein